MLDSGQKAHKLGQRHHLPFKTLTYLGIGGNTDMRDPKTSTTLYKILTPQEKEEMSSTNWAGTALDVCALHVLVCELACSRR